MDDWRIHPRSKAGLSKEKTKAIIDYFESVRVLVRESDVEYLTHDIIPDARWAGSDTCGADFSSIPHEFFVILDNVTIYPIRG